MGWAQGERPDTALPPTHTLSVQAGMCEGWYRQVSHGSKVQYLSPPPPPPLHSFGGQALQAGRSFLDLKEKKIQPLTDRSSKASLANTLEQKAIWPHESDQRNIGNLSAFIWMTRYFLLGINYDRLEI